MVRDRNTVDSGNENRNLVRWSGFISVIQGLLIFIPTIILGAAINWPESLDDPASIALPRLLENEGAVRVGYFAYLILSLLFAITMVLLAQIVLGKDSGILIKIIVAFAIASALARSIGIIRWLVPMFDLAKIWEQSTTEDQKYVVSVVFETLNSYGGTIGEVLGVSIFAAISIFFLSIANLIRRTLPKWISVFGLISVLGLLWTSTGIVGIDPGSSADFIGTTIVQLWFLFTGFWLLIKGKTLVKN
jgi:hypothetical protein